jgi:D-lactate dehydrogenase (cytochrome)
MEWIENLKQLLSEQRVTTNETILFQHSKDESYHDPHLPDVVVFPESTEEVSEVMKLANANNIPVVPFGVGSSLEGSPIPVQGGISIDYQLMNRVLEIRPEDFLVKVQPGITRKQLNLALKPYGLFFTVDPGADATLGGMTSTNASGTTSVRYGVMRDAVKGLEIVLANGDIIHTGGLAAKSSSGYHLTGMFVGSEGTLGAFTEITLRVYGIPESSLSCRAVFPNVRNAVDAAVGILSGGIPVARVELVDARSIKQVNIHSETHYLEKPTLFLEFHGNEAGLKQDVEFAQEIVFEEHCLQFDYETDSIKSAQLWNARHNLAYAFLHGFPGKKQMVTDVCLPLSELTGAILHARELIDQSSLDGAVLGHVGDGNFHALIMIDPNNKEDVASAHGINEKIVQYALRRGGTCTGEHGVGIGKSKYMEDEHGLSLSVMKMIKQQLDPNGILNPGKMFMIN